MNDNEIIKALECCTSKGGCLECPLYNPEYTGTCVKSVFVNALGLINHQKAEIERLKAENGELKLKMSYMKEPNTIGDIHEMGAW